MAAAPGSPVVDARDALELWRSVDTLVDRAASLDDLREHSLELLALARWRSEGRALPEALVVEERQAVLSSLAVSPLLARVRNVVDGTILVVKGPELAALYPNGTRGFADLDLLVEDAPAAQAALLADGFEEIGDPDLFRDIHHLRPLWLRSFPLPIELHSKPKWLDGVEPPSFEVVAAGAVPSASGVEGVLAPARARHAVLTAVHSWAHEPLRRLRELVDVAALASGLPDDELVDAARELGVERLWRSTANAIDAIFRGGPSTLPLRTWARNVAEVRRRTVFESHVSHLLAPFAARSTGYAIAESARALRDELRPKADEPWRKKLRRTGRSLRNAGKARTAHDTQLEERELL